MDVLVMQLGILTTAQLMGVGWTKWQIERAVRGGALTRVRPGWFARPGCDAAALAAVRAGGCISCFSALRLHGVWVPERKGRHVRLPEHRRVRRKRRGSAVAKPRTCRLRAPEPPIAAAVDDLRTAVRCVLRCGTREECLVVLDSILHLQLARRDELEEWLRGAPQRERALLELADARSESGTESMVRWRLRALQLAVRIQVRVMDGVRVDLLIGDRLIIECDSREHHSEADAYESDRRRDRRLAARGFIVLRLSYRQIHDEWAAIEEDILAIVRAGRHRLPRRRTARPSAGLPEEFRIPAARCG
ncbi:DUF559 domain-containing protein [Agrococcus carbonis]|nr:DUF559 domain-containing protein [Agrococcus carbonis]